MKKTWSKKSRDTVPLKVAYALLFNDYIYVALLHGYLQGFLHHPSFFNVHNFL